MKKVFFLVVATAILAGCASSSRLVSTARELDFKGMKPVTVTDVIADLDISTNKITYLYIPSKAANNAGSDNVVKTAIREALVSNGNADVLVGLDSQIKYASDNTIESITITGYPAKYVNFRSVNEKYILDMTKMYIDLNLKINANPEAAAAEVVVPDLIPERVVYSIKDAGAEPEKTLFPVLGKLGKLKIRK
jgi:hypothetical protein